MTNSIWQIKNSNTGDFKFDFVILGAGIAGLSVGYWLTEYYPDKSILILDQNQVGSGASGRNAGFLTKGSASFYLHLTSRWGKKSALNILNFASESISLVESHLLKNNSEVEFNKTISETIVDENLKKSISDELLFKPEEFNFFNNDRSNLLSRYYPYSIFYASENEYKINPIQLLNFLEKILRKRNVKILEFSQAFKLENNLIFTENGIYEPKKIFLCLNGYTSQFNPALGKIIKPQRAQMIAAELENSFDIKSLVYDPQNRVYFRSYLDNYILIGGKRTSDPLTEETGIDHINPKIQIELEDYLGKKLGLKFRIHKRWSGIMGFTESELPLISKIRNHNELFILGGFSGHGMGFGFKSAKEVVDLASGRIPESLFHSINPINIDW
jgi:gamma-glutamylputrescine oxidase